MKLAALCFLIRQEKPKQILLGFKKEGFGKGKLVGYGGKIERDETPRQAIIREIKEEAQIVLEDKDIFQVGRILFTFPQKPGWDHEVIIFTANEWTGDAKETDEMEPCWVSIEKIPYRKMWDDSQYWLPAIIAGDNVEVKFVYDKDNSTVLSIEKLLS